MGSALEWKLSEHWMSGNTQVEKSRPQEHSGTQTSFTCGWCDFFWLTHSATLKIIFTNLGLREHSPFPHVKELLSDSGRNKLATQSRAVLSLEDGGPQDAVGAQRKDLQPDRGWGRLEVLFRSWYVPARDGERLWRASREGAGRQWGQQKTWLFSPASGQEGGVRSLKWSFDTVFLSSGELPRAATESISRVDAYYSSVFI